MYDDSTEHRITVELDGLTYGAVRVIHNSVLLTREYIRASLIRDVCKRITDEIARLAHE